MLPLQIEAFGNAVMTHLRRAEAKTLSDLSKNVNDQINQLEQLIQISEAASCTEDTIRDSDGRNSNLYDESLEEIRIELIGKLNAMERLLYEPVEYIKSLAHGSVSSL